MTVLNYTDPVPTPAPLTTGTTVQSYIDPLGDVWVAKNGVRGGNWSRARDTVHARWTRNNTWNWPTANGPLNLDTAIVDIFTLYTTNNFVVPVAGLYLVSGKLSGNFTATGQTLQAQYWHNGAIDVVAGHCVCAVVVPYHMSMSSAIMQCVAGDTIALYISASVSVAGYTGQGQTMFSIDYLGTG